MAQVTLSISDNHWAGWGEAADNPRVKIHCPQFHVLLASMKFLINVSSFSIITILF